MYTKQLAECLPHNKAQTKTGKEKNLYFFFYPNVYQVQCSVFSVPFYAPRFPFSMIFLPPEGPPLKFLSKHVCL